MKRQFWKIKLAVLDKDESNSDSINKNQCFKLLPFLSSVIKDYLEVKNKILNKKKEVL